MPFDHVPAEVRRRMSRIRKRDSKPEMIVRRVAHRLGYRFRLNRRDLPGTPDLVFPRLKRIVFVHGCFWHQHSGCRHANVPNTRPEYWLPKLARTKGRDAKAELALAAMGWEVLTLWECELRDIARLERQLRRFLTTANSTEISVS
jgi:DNA mismatch endonuclease (patch repair protein)